MPILTEFSFDHEVAPTRLAAFKALPPDLLGLLRPLTGPKPTDPTKKAIRSWSGTGFNMIWRPNFGGEFGSKDFFLQLMFTKEKLEFTDITGARGIANRSLFEHTVRLGGAGYVQTIDDAFDDGGQHFETGVWANVPAIANPQEPATVVRMGSIPHGTTINLQGTAFTTTQPQFEVASITPFKIGSPDDGATDLIHFDEEDLDKTSTSRTDLARVKALTKEQFTNPTLLLEAGAAKRKIVKTTVLKLSSQSPDPNLPSPRPDSGGGTDNIAFLVGKGAPPTGGPNAVAPKVTTTFWIEELEGGDLQLQYIQRVLLNFNRLSWPHISLATLTLS